MQHRLGIAGRLLTAAEYQITGSLKRNRTVEIGCHRAIGGIIFVLAIDDGCHFLHHLADKGFGADAVVKPVGDMLR